MVSYEAETAGHQRGGQRVWAARRQGPSKETFGRGEASDRPEGSPGTLEKVVMAEYTAQVHVDLGATAGKLQMAVQRVIDLTAFGLVAAERLQSGPIELPGTNFRISPSVNTAMSFETARDEIRPW